MEVVHLRVGLTEEFVPMGIYFQLDSGGILGWNSFPGSRSQGKHALQKKERKNVKRRYKWQADFNQPAARVDAGASGNAGRESAGLRASGRSRLSASPY